MDNYVIVYNFSELKTAILGSKEYIRLGADIVCGSGGIAIPLLTSHLVIDGTDPIDGSIHTILDYNSSGFYDTIYIDYTNLISKLIEVQNINLQIRNYYGFVSAYDIINNANVTIKYTNVDFSGTQPFFNPFGKAIVENSNFLVDKLYSSVCPSNELFEINKATLSGTINITHNSTANSCFWFRNAAPSLIISDDAIINISITSRELCYCDTQPIIVFGKNSYCNIVSNHGLFYSTGTHQATSILIEEGAQVYIEQLSRNGTVPTIRTLGNITIEDGAIFHVFVKYASSAPLIEFTVTSLSMIFNKPKSIILYNYSNTVFKWPVGGGIVALDCRAISYWKTAISFPNAGGLNDTPLYNWSKADKSLIIASATCTLSATTIVTSNIIAGVDSQNAMTTTTFDIINVRVLALGEMFLDVFDINDIQTNIIGETMPKSNIGVYVNEQTYIDVSDELGNFDVSVEAIPAYHQITIKSNYNFLTFLRNIIIDGSLSFDIVPNTMPFRAISVPSNISKIKRKDPDWALTVKDTRLEGDDWYLLATIDDDLHTEGENIENAVIYEYDLIEQILSKNYTIVWEGKANKNEVTITSVSWDEIEGILLKIIPETSCKSGIYETDLNWYLVDSGKIIK